MNPADLINYANAIKSIESSGGNYGLVGPRTRNGDRAYGAFQVMGNNIPGWTQKHFGTALTPDQFLQNKDAQDAVFNGEFGSYVQKYGNPQDAASAWFTGRPLAQGGRSSDGYITGNQYVDKFNKYLGGGSAVDAVNAAAGVKPQGDGGALSFAGEDAQAGGGNATPAPGILFQGEGDNKAAVLGSMLANAGAALAGISNPNAGANLRGLAQNIAAGGKSKYQYQMGANGQLVRINNETGTVDSISIPGAQREQKTFGNVSITDPITGLTRTGARDMTTGKIQWDEPTSSPSGGGGAAAPAQGATLTMPDGSPLPPGVNLVEMAKKRADAAVKRAEDFPQATQSVQDAAANLSRMKEAARAVMDNPALSRITGKMGVLPNIPGGDAANVQADLNNLKSQITTSVLQSMRNASKTGGALGNVSDKENALLERNLAALDQTQSPEKFKKSLQAIIDYADGATQRVQDAYYQTYPNAKRPEPASTAAPKPTAPAEAPKADNAPKYQEGQTATGPNGKKAVFTNGKWVIQQ